MSIIMNSTGALPEDHKYKAFFLARLAVDDKPDLFDYSYLGQRICVAGESIEEVKTKAHELIDRLFDGLENKLDKVIIDVEGTTN